MGRTSVLARIYLHAVLPCLEVLTERDGSAKLIAGQWKGSIRFHVSLRGPSCTVRLGDGRARVSAVTYPGPTIALFFPHPAMLTNVFEGKKFALALPWRGLLSLAGLKVFSSLAKRLQEVLENDPDTSPLKAEMTLGIVARALAVLSVYDPVFSRPASKLTGTAQFRIRKGPGAYVRFRGKSAEAFTGICDGSDLTIEFDSGELFLKATRDEVDTVAETCLGRISVSGDLHMAQIINQGLDELATYLG